MNLLNKIVQSCNYIVYEKQIILTTSLHRYPYHIYSTSVFMIPQIQIYTVYLYHTESKMTDEKAIKGGEDNLKKES